MDEIIPLQFIKKHFKVTIFKITQMHRRGSVFYYDAVTCYGNMVLIIQHYTADFYHIKTVDFLHSRHKALMDPNCKSFPLIYEQQICVNHPQQIVCMTLLENTQIGCKQNIQELTYKNIFTLGLCGLWLQENPFTFELQQFQLKQLLLSAHSKKLYFDFTCLIPKLNDNTQNFKVFLDSLIDLLANFYPKTLIRQVIFIKERIYKFNPQFLRKCSDWFQLVVFLNTLPQLVVETISSLTSKHKKSKINKLQGNPIIIYNEKKYEDFMLLDGVCINSLVQIFYQDLVEHFFKENESSQYMIRKETYLTVHINQNKKGDCNTVLVIPQVNKIQCINFFISYLKYINPIIKKISYSSQENTLTLDYINQSKNKKRIKFFFYQEYIVKDQQISMIIQKSKLQLCCVNLRNMQLTDPFLMFLSNSPKLMSIKELDISNCFGLTELGVNTLLISPFCKNVQYLNLSGTPILDTSVQTISLKSSIKKIILNNCKTSNDNGIDLSKMKLTHLQALGIRLDLNVNESLKVLKIDQQMDLDGLKMLRNLRLTQLKIKLIQSKKAMMSNVFSTFYKEANPIKCFVEGNSNKTLKKLDISYSQIRFKTVKPLLWMSELEQVVLDECQKIGHEFQAISPKIFSVSLMNLPIAVQNLSSILWKTKMLMTLNVRGTNVKKHELVTFILNTKKYITNLMISQEQYTNKLIEKNAKNNFEFVENVQVLIQRLLLKEQESVLNYILYKVSQSYKALRLVCAQNNKGTLLDKVNKFMKMGQISILKNLYINNCSLEQLNSNKQTIKLHRKYPLVKKKKGEVLQFIIKPYETIDQIMYNFINFINKNQQKQIDINMKHNKVVDQYIIEMFSRFAAHRIRSIDFRYSLFTIVQVIASLFQFPVLQSINQGEYGIQLHKNNFVNMSQKYLKFFMKAHAVKTLSISLENIQEIQILFSVIFHIIDHHSTTIKSIVLSIEKIVLNNECIIFLQKLFSLPILETLHLTIQDCKIQNSVEQCWQQVNGLQNIKNLKLILSSKSFPILKLKKLQNLHIQFSDNNIQQNILVKSLKNLNSIHLKELKIMVNNSQNIQHFSKLANAIERFQNLQSIQINMEYCPLKQHSLFDGISSLSKMGKLKMLQMNISFAVQNLNELLTTVEQGIQNSKSLFMKIICVTDKSMNFVFNQEELSQQGIQFIL